MLLCCRAWAPWDQAIRQPESKDFESELPLYVFNHLLRDGSPDLFFFFFHTGKASTGYSTCTF